MVIKALRLPRGTRPVVLTGDHEESPYREFYKIEYRTAGRRAPISNAEKMLENAALDGETWFRTFFLVVVGTYIVVKSILPTNPCVYILHLLDFRSLYSNTINFHVGLAIFLLPCL
jgi:hypothetical protein